MKKVITKIFILLFILSGCTNSKNQKNDSIAQILSEKNALLSNVASVTFDIVQDVFNKNDSEKINSVKISGSDREPGTDDETLIEGEYSGTAKIIEKISGSNRNGTISFEDFKNRFVLPSFSSESMDYNLTISNSKIEGTINATNVTVEDVTFSFSANYDLFFDDNGLLRGTVNGTITMDGISEDFSYNYDTPILMSFDIIYKNSEDEVTGNLSTASNAYLKLAVYSNAPVNWINRSLDSPNGNIYGGGAETGYSKLGQETDNNFFHGFKEEQLAYWTYTEQDHNFNEFMPSGEYTWKVSVKNTAELNSNTLTNTDNLTGAYDEIDAPEITKVHLITANTKTNGTDPVVIFEIVAKSDIPVSFLGYSFDGPLGNISAGSGSVTFINCTELTKDHNNQCLNKDDTYWYYSNEISDLLSKWAPNGQYKLNRIKVSNAANKESTAYPNEVSFYLSNKSVANTPSINSVDMYYIDTNSNKKYLNNNDCITATSVPDPLKIGIEVNASSNAPVNRINANLDGPAGNIMGGGGRTNAVYHNGTYIIETGATIDSPALFAPKGTYKWSNVSIENEGMKQSSTVSSGLEFKLKTTCP